LLSGIAFAFLRYSHEREVNAYGLKGKNKRLPQRSKRRLFHSHRG
jgi:hypothetical protein